MSYSSTCIKLCNFILKEHFGDHVASLGNDLQLNVAPQTIRLMNMKGKLNKNSVKRALCVLLQYNLLEFSPGRMSDFAQYKILPDQILLFLRYPKYLMLLKKQYGNEVEVLVEEILRLGRCSVTQLIVRAYNRLKNENAEEIDKGLILRLRDQFEVLVNKQYLQRSPTIIEDKPVPVLSVGSELAFTPSKVELSVLISHVESGTWDTTDTVTWVVNPTRLHQDMRDDLLVNAITRRVSQEAGEALRLLLRQASLVTRSEAPVSGSVTISQLRDYCRKTKQESHHLEENLSVISEDTCGFITRDDLSSIPAYVVETQKAIRELTWSLLDNAVEVRYGTNAARIFRLIREQEYIEQEEIQKKAMLPDKEGKLLTYTLLQNGWIHQHELKKGLQKTGPSKTFYLFCINFNRVVRMYIEMCYKSLLNCATRREFEQSQNSALLDKHLRIQAVTLQMKLKGSPEEDIAEIASLITPPEANLVEQVHATINKLSQAELEIDSTLFILQLTTFFR